MTEKQTFTVEDNSRDMGVPEKPTSLVIEITDRNFNEVLLNSSSPVLVDFFSRLCGPCNSAKPIVERLADEFKGILVVGVYDILAKDNDGQEIVQKFGVGRIPQFLMFRGNDLVMRLTGYRPLEKMREEVRSGLLSPQEKPQS